MNSADKQILVIGATGGVGRFICNEITRLFGAKSLIVGDYKINRGKSYAKFLGDNVKARLTDVGIRESIAEAVKNTHAVIVTAHQKEPVVQSICVEQRIPCLDITVFPEFIGRVRSLEARARSSGTPLIAAAGFIPGLSGIMICETAKKLDRITAIDVGLLQSSQASTGTAGITDMLDMISQDVEFSHNGQKCMFPGFTRKRVMVYPEHQGEHMQRLVNFWEASAVSEYFNISDVNYWTSFDKALLNFVVALLRSVGFLKLFHNERTRVRAGKIMNSIMGRGKSELETTYVQVEVTGQKDKKPCKSRMTISVPSDYGTTAMSVVAMIKRILQGEIQPKGVKFPFEIFSLQNIIRAIDCEEIEIYNEMIELIQDKN